MESVWDFNGVRGAESWLVYEFHSAVLITLYVFEIFHKETRVERTSCLSHNWKRDNATGMLSQPLGSQHQKIKSSGPAWAT